MKACTDIYHVFLLSPRSTLMLIVTISLREQKGSFRSYVYVKSTFALPIDLLGRFMSTAEILVFRKLKL